MAKIPFNTKFRPQIESGEYKVETRDGRDARIICWDSKAKDARHDTRPIIALVTTPIPGLESLIQCGENGILYKDAKDRNDLFIIIPDPELTEFEADVLVALLEFVEEVDANDLKRVSKELLELAREQFQPEIDAEFEKAYKTADEVQYRKGREEALKNLPRWIPNRFDKHNFETCKAYLDTPRYLCYQDKMIDVSELIEKLPGFKEDCNE